MNEKTDPSRYGLPWNRQELILAFDLYCRIPFKKTKKTNPEVIELANLLQRSPSSIARKLGNFGAFDPELSRRNISGLGHGSKLDEEIWDEFHANWNRLVEEASEIRAKLEFSHIESLQHDSHDDLVRPSGESEIMRMTKQRRHQTFFREAVLSSYGGRCCITGLAVKECLIASHIIPWSKNEASRTDPSNGLCMFSLADRLFDSGLMTISGYFRVQISSDLIRSNDDAVRTHILPLHDREIMRPYRFMPREEYLVWHRENLFQK